MRVRELKVTQDVQPMLEFDFIYIYVDVISLH